MTEATRKLFKEYERAFNVLDVDQQVPMFADHFISAGPRDSIAQSRGEFARMAHQAAEFYKNVRQTSARIRTTSTNNFSFPCLARSSIPSYCAAGGSHASSPGFPHGAASPHSQPLR